MLCGIIRELRCNTFLQDMAYKSVMLRRGNVTVYQCFSSHHVICNSRKLFYNTHQPYCGTKASSFYVNGGFRRCSVPYTSLFSNYSHCPLNRVFCINGFSTDRPNAPMQSDVPNADDEEERQKRQKSWQRMKLSLILMGSMFIVLGSYSLYMLGSPDRDEHGSIMEDEFSSLPFLLQLCKRFVHKLKYFTKVIQEPSAEKLLPDPLEYPYIQPPYTLILELTDLLVHPDWTYKTGWRFKKRPNVDYFLEQVGPPLFEVVIFTAEQGITVFPILNQLDKNGVIAYRLVRDSTDFIDGHHVKNLDCLNRDLKRVIVIDWNPQSIKLHPDNAFIVPRWDGSDEDTTLIDLAAFLKAIAFNKVDDVREVLRYYRQFENPVEAFRVNQRKLLEQLEEQERIEQLRKEHPPLTSKFTKSYVSR